MSAARQLLSAAIQSNRRLIRAFARPNDQVIPPAYHIIPPADQARVARQRVCGVGFGMGEEVEGRYVDPCCGGHSRHPLVATHSSPPIPPLIPSPNPLARADLE
ncbi:unnamed protein product, partial [Closterium sp. NIES-64]